LLKSETVPHRKLNLNPDVQLMFIGKNGRPFYNTVDNLDAARTISTDDVWPGGGGGYNLSGSETVSGELGIWDAGAVLVTHNEFDGRVTQKDSPASTHYHATHVAGTMVGEGQNSDAKGMSFEGLLDAYDWDFDNSEMASAAAAGLKISNHSYGFITGWYNDGSDWYWYGDISISTIEDYGFGFYGDNARAWDEIAYNAPYYNIVKSAGNDRDDDGPSSGSEHFVWDGDWVTSTDNRNADGWDNGYDCIAWYSTAKNIITVGAVHDIPLGYAAPELVFMSNFSGWGPTDDGRIKPDISANGISLYSCIDNPSNAAYASYSGTSMSSPNVSGSLNLLIQHYEATHEAVTPLASTMKAILIHTADEAGLYPGPDYRFGWGLINTLSAADLITADAVQPGLIIEEAISEEESNTHSLFSDGSGPLRVTIVWTDPPGTPPAPSLDPPTPMLVNDLDIRLEHKQSATVYYPFVMDPANPANAAGTGDNIVDNVEQVHIAEPLPGGYLVTISHKGTLLPASEQWYSIIATGEMNTCFDSDGDGYGDPDIVENECPDDNCPDVFGLDLGDPDGDSYGNPCDNCPDVSNPGQADRDEDGIGDACDFICGDVDNDEVIGILDIVYLINNIYKDGPDPFYPESADVDNDSKTGILDIVALINNIYKDGPDLTCPDNF
jgi:hypothetical protein